MKKFSRLTLSDEDKRAFAAGERQPSRLQRLALYEESQKAKTLPKVEPKPEPKEQSSLEKIFSELEAVGVTREQIDTALDNLKENEGVEELKEKFITPEKVETIDTAALYQQYQAELRLTPAALVPHLKLRFRRRGLDIQ